MSTIDPAAVRARLDSVIAAMQSAGVWDVQRPNDDAFVDFGPFGMRTMAFEQWLRYVFVPNVEALIASNGPWPRSSSVGVHATREWDGQPGPEGITRALSEFDSLFG